MDRHHPTSTLFPYTTLFRSTSPPPSRGRWRPPRDETRAGRRRRREQDRKSTRLNYRYTVISYAVFCLKKKNFQRYSLCMTVKERHVDGARKPRTHSPSSQLP